MTTRTRTLNRLLKTTAIGWCLFCGTVAVAFMLSAGDVPTVIAWGAGSLVCFGAAALQAAE